MKDYYYEKLGEATLKVELAMVGYSRKMSDLARRLINDDECDHRSIIEKITELRDALDDMQEEARRYKGLYLAELEKEEKVC